MKKSLIINLSAPREKRNLLEFIRTLEGSYRVELCKHRPRRSDRQNRFYWPCFVQPFAEFMQAQGEFITEEEAHFMFKRLFLKRDIINPKTGEVVGETVRSTTELDTSEFNIYLERVAQWLAEKVGIVVPEPSTYREMEVAHA